MRSSTLSVQLNHTVVSAVDNQKSAAFLADILGLEVGRPLGPFIPVTLDNGVTLDFAMVAAGADIHPQHYAFLVSDEVFDAAFAKIVERGLTYWPDPRQSRENEINHNDGGRGFYFLDPCGHFLELITVPYGGWN